MRGRCQVGWTFREECEGGGQEAGAGPDGSDSGACILCTHLSGPSQEGMGAPGRPEPILQGAHCGPAFPMLKGRPKAPSL